MGYFHALYSPFRVGDRVRVEQGDHSGQFGTVIKVDPPNAFDGEEATYTVQLDNGDCETFDFWSIALA